MAQELNCIVHVLAPQVVTVDKKVFESLEGSVAELMNNTKWTKDAFQGFEKIECDIQITLTSQVATDQFEGSIQVQSRRQIYKTSYSSVMFNYKDPDFMIKYVQYQPLVFSENAHTTNLTSVLAFYAYMILAIDYDSFAPSGGTPWYQMAQKIVNNAQIADEKGWKSFEGTKNRYWMVENLLVNTFAPIRDVIYKYHRLGLDIMWEKKDEGRAVIVKSLDQLKTVHQVRPGSFSMQLFCYAKADELVNIFTPTFTTEKTPVVNTLNLIDPGNGAKYQKILQ